MYSGDPAQTGKQWLLQSPRENRSLRSLTQYEPQQVVHLTVKDLIFKQLAFSKRQESPLKIRILFLNTLLILNRIMNMDP